MHRECSQKNALTSVFWFEYPMVSFVQRPGGPGRENGCGAITIWRHAKNFTENIGAYLSLPSLAALGPSETFGAREMRSMTRIIKEERRLPR